MDANKLIAHRGDNTNYPENSLAGIKSALDAGALYVEFDVQMNADHSLVVIHDTDFKRTANNPTNLFELKNDAMKLISVHEPVTFGDKHQPTFVSPLSEILELFTHYPKAQALVEIKRESIWFWGLDFFMTRFLKVINGHESQCIIISFGVDTLEYTKAHSQLSTGLVFYDYQSCNLDIAKNLQPDFMICSHLIIPEDVLWKGNWLWVIYSINNIEKMNSILNRKDVALVETDNICLMLKA